MDFKPASLKRKTQTKQNCKYGASCYQKSPEHRKKFKHPESSQKKARLSKKGNGNHGSEDVSENLLIETLASGSANSNRAKTKEETVGSIPRKDNEETVRSILRNENEETVGNILKSMPQDFFDFWEFCSSLNKSNPEEALAEVGIHLVGVYDLLSKKIPSDKSVVLHCHWRYYYDPPEFQTVIKQDGNDLKHIGYFRDDPAELPSILASNSASVGPKLTLKGDNIFAAVKTELNSLIKNCKKKSKLSKLSKIQTDLKNFAKKKKYSLEIQTAKVKARQAKIVSRTFHGLGIVVPVANDVGYRPLPDSDATLKLILKKIVDADNENKRLEEEESLDEILTNLQFANDECDYGMGLELGIDLFCFGHPYFHPHILSILPLAYKLLNRPKYGAIVKAHLANRVKGCDLNCLI